MSIYLAHDGSIHDDWVSHYAIQFAAHHRSRRLTIVHVENGRDAEELRRRFQQIEEACQRVGVAADVRFRRNTGDVASDILAATPQDEETVLLCALRVRERLHGFLSGTVSERLLKRRPFPTLALRVVHPGLLGVPRRLLVPVSARTKLRYAAIPYLGLFVPELTHVHLLYVRKIGAWRYRMLSAEGANRLRMEGEELCRSLELEIQQHLQLPSEALDASVVVSDDIPKEIAIAAAKTKSRLICLAASERNLVDRFLYGNPIEQVLRDATCDVAVYRALR